MSSLTQPVAVSVARESTRSRAATAIPALIGVASFALYAFGLDRSGWANSYYSAAVLAGSQSWKAFFFGSVDASNFITVDKPPAALWLMELSARVFGVSSLSILLPQAILGALTAVVLYFTVRRVFGPLAGAIAATVSALTPVSVLMFRYNNPDALLTFLLVLAAYAMTRALEDGRTRWLLLSAAVVGLAFNTKYLQADLVLPAFVLTYLLFGHHGWGKRCLQLLAAGAALVVSSGWWLAIVDAIPAASRPYIGGSTNNTVIELVFGYDGLGRILGQGFFGGVRSADGGFAGGGPGGGGGFGGSPGLLRLFNEQVGGQVSWLIPLAIAGLIAGIWLSRRAPRQYLGRAAFVLWGLWLVVSALVFSYAQGIFHAYYTVALAPAIGALVGAGLPALWRLRSRGWAGGLLLGGSIAVTAVLGYVLLARTPDFVPWLRYLELGVGLAAAAALLIPLRPVWRGAARSLLALGVAAVMLGPVAYDAQTMASTHSSGDPTAGPSVRNALTGFGGGSPAGAAPAGVPAGVEAANAGLITYLEANQGSARWLVAANGANAAASIELATGKPVMAMGGFIGSDPAPTLDQLRSLIKSGQLRFVLLGGGGGDGGAFGGGVGTGAPGRPGRGSFPPTFASGASAAGAPGTAAGTRSAIVNWVTSNCRTVTTGMTTVYDCQGAVA